MDVYPLCSNFPTFPSLPLRLFYFYLYRFTVYNLLEMCTVHPHGRSLLKGKICFAHVLTKASDAFGSRSHTHAGKGTDKQLESSRRRVWEKAAGSCCSFTLPHFYLAISTSYSTQVILGP